MNPHETPPTPAAIDALLAGHALGDLDERERQQLAGLLRQRPELRARLEEFSTTLNLLPLALHATAAPPLRLRRRLLEPSNPQRPPLPWLLPALLALGLAIIGAELHQTREQLAQVQQQLQAARGPSQVSPGRRLMLTSAATDTIASANPPSGEVLVTGNPTHNVLMVNNLPPPPPGHMYRLWADVDGRKVGCVAFIPTEQGHVAMMIPPMPTSLANGISVTVESNPMGTAPKGPMVLSTGV
jgi:hypothetical protein